jgi:hypothetical protein
MRRCTECGKRDNEATELDSYCQYCCHPYQQASEVSEARRGKAQGERLISEIAYEIKRLWPKVWFGAVPYLQAMCTLDTVDDNYGLDSGRSVVTYFLANAATWRGEDARRIKAELKALLAAKAEAVR